jgi:hypothetical protein
MIDKIKSILNLSPHIEGGFFKETYRSDETVSAKELPERYSGGRFFGAAIYYMITSGTFSAMHRLKSDEIFHFYLGDPVEMLQLFPDGTGKTVIIGSDLLNGMRPQVTVQRGVWQGLRLQKGGNYALMGTTVSPGFDYSDFEKGFRKNLLQEYPDFKELILALTRE